MRVLFAGSPAIAVPSLHALYELKEIELVGVLTNPDTAKGRHGKLVPTEVGEAIQRLLLEKKSPRNAYLRFGADFHGEEGEGFILKPYKLDAAARQQVSSLKPDILVSFAYGHIFGPKFLSLFPLGGINIHPSLLPKYRGPSPIQAAILNRDTITGISIQALAQEMDCGDIFISEQLPLTSKETAGCLTQTIAEKAAQMLIDVLKQIANGKIHKTPQNHQIASYCKLISRNDGIINWNESVLEIEAKIRAFNPWPLCRTIHNGRELIILKADVYKGNTNNGKPGTVLGTVNEVTENGILIQTGDGILIVTELQYQAKKALFWRDFLNGARDFISSQLQ